MGFKNLKFFAFLCFPMFFFVLIDAQVPIPPKLDGFWYENRPFEADSIFIEAFFDPVCPDSRDSWPGLKQTLQHYGSRVTLLVHTFPLPYHDNAFVSSRALHIINKLNTSATYGLLEEFFQHQEKFYGVATVNMSRANVNEKIINFVTKAVGTSYYSAIRSGFTNSKTDRATRIAFKYGCSRGVYGTPIFFVNGIALPYKDSPLDYKGWKGIIDPLLANQLERNLHFF
ncbi:Thioredoxin superfamily protein [Forsythia ovata]|uniref:Thioredoxin superfamily protein n=1 Tax=Forsythia ovata TaxID=205694 RepID=A0ABD1PW91_9LAMI